MGDLVKMEPEPAKYLEISVLERIVQCAEESYEYVGDYDYTPTKSAAYAILGHYFQPKDSFLFLGECAPEDGNSDETIIQIGHFHNENVYPDCCLIAEVKRYEAPVNKKSLQRLLNLASQTDIPRAYYAIIFIHGSGNRLLQIRQNGLQ